MTPDFITAEERKAALIQKIKEDNEIAAAEGNDAPKMVKIRLRRIETSRRTAQDAVTGWEHAESMYPLQNLY